MKVKQIGNGGAFNYDQCNSSFLIENNNELLLVDCGYSVFSELRTLDANKEIDLKDLKYIYITHMDDDHIGSLKSLMYYQYFMNNISINLIFDMGIAKDMNNYIKFDEFNKVKVDNRFVVPEKPLVIPNIINQFLDLDNKLRLSTFNGDHHTDCYGLIINDGNSSIAISGDTIATKNIEENCKNCDIVFHDYSLWNEPSKQVHACEKNINDTYSEEFINKLIYYHTGKDFNREWNDLDWNKSIEIGR